MNRPPCVLNRMRAATCHSICISSSDYENGYSTTTLPSGIDVTRDEEK